MSDLASTSRRAARVVRPKKPPPSPVNAAALLRVCQGLPSRSAGMHADFPFENIVFGGCAPAGAFVYAGAVAALEELDVASHIKRYAGASAGALTAALCAIGLGSAELQKVLRSGELESAAIGF